MLGSMESFGGEKNDVGGESAGNSIIWWGMICPGGLVCASCRRWTHYKAA